MCVLVAQSCPTLCNPIDYTLPGFSVHEILQARILKWVAISFSRGISNPGIEPRSPALQAAALPSELLGKPKPHYMLLVIYFHMPSDIPTNAMTVRLTTKGQRMDRGAVPGNPHAFP